MTRFTGADDLSGAEFHDTNLRGARFVGASLADAVMRGVDVDGLDIEAPWLLDGDGSLRVNGVDVTAYVSDQLDSRFIGRAQRRASDPDGLRAAWSALELAWDGALQRAAAMPEGSVDINVDGEWSFAQTLRHLVLATDLWLGKSVIGLAEPFHPLGLTNAEAEEEGFDMSVFATEPPSYAEVLAARAGRVALVREFLATVTEADLDVVRANPWAPEHPETTRSCLHTILEEEWEHLRYALRDLDAIEAAE